MKVGKQERADSPLANVPFTERDVSDARRLLTLIVEMQDEENGEPGLVAQTIGSRQEPVDREIFLSRAKRYFRNRRLRKQFFSRATFGEPAWDILLVLYISDFSGRLLTVGRLADWVDAPLSTAQRWIGYLEKERLLGKEMHPSDKRMAFVRLLNKGRALLDDYFAAAEQ